MTSSFRMAGKLAACIAAVTLIAATAALAFGMTQSDPVSSGMLGPDWQCTRLALVFTSCTRIGVAKAASAAGARKLCLRRPLALGMADLAAPR